MMSSDAPKHKIVAHQKQKDVPQYYEIIVDNGHHHGVSDCCRSNSGGVNNNHNNDLLVTKTKRFPIGSLFYFTIQTAASLDEIKYLSRTPEKSSGMDDNDNDRRACDSDGGGSSINKNISKVIEVPYQFDNDDDNDDDEDDDDEDDDEKSRNPLTIEVPPLTKLIIDTVTVEPQPSNNDTMSLYVSTDSNEYACICPFLSGKNHSQSMVQNLNISVIGPTSVQFALVRSSSSSSPPMSTSAPVSCKAKLGHANLFGRIEMINEDIGNAVIDARTTHVFDELQQMNDAESALDAAANCAICNGATAAATSYKPPSKISFENINTYDSALNDDEDTNEMDEEKDSMNSNEMGNMNKESKNIEGEESNIEKNVNAVIVEEDEEEGKSRDKTNNEKKRKFDEHQKQQSATTISSFDNVQSSNKKQEVVAKVQRLSRKQRKKLAKQKAKELQEVISKQQGHNSGTSSTVNNDKKKSEKDEQKSTSNNESSSSKQVSLTKQRALSCGVLVQDIVHGTGPVVRLGRKVSINYVGTLSDNGKEFDKNNSKSNPLVFRIGTGEVIKGLEKGMEGMKVGGERSITIPAELGYGKKRQRKIPPNSTLCFDVKLLSVGGEGNK